MGGLPPPQVASRNFQALSLRRAARARALSGGYTEAADLLSFLARVCELQARVDPNHPLGALSELVELARQSGSRLLTAGAGEMDDERCAAAMCTYLQTADSSRPDAFFARVLLMPVAANATDPADLRKSCEHALGDRLASPASGAPAWPSTPSPCPWCAHPPQLVVLTPDGHGTRVSLACSLCLRTRDTPRGQCPGCGQGDERRLAYYTENLGATPRGPRTDGPIRGPGQLVVCEECQGYLQVTTTAGDPFLGDVDEVAGVALDAWAAQQGWHKVQVNLLGL